MIDESTALYCDIATELERLEKRVREIEAWRETFLVIGKCGHSLSRRRVYYKKATVCLDCAKPKKDTLK